MDHEPSSGSQRRLRRRSGDVRSPSLPDPAAAGLAQAAAHAVPPSRARARRAVRHRPLLRPRRSSRAPRRRHRPVGEHAGRGAAPRHRHRPPAGRSPRALVRRTIRRRDDDRRDGERRPRGLAGVLANLHRALRPGGHLYLTVEEHLDIDFAAVHDALLARGLPAVLGEVVDGDVAGYHYYPSREQVIGWTAAAGLTLIDEADHQEDGWGYRHLLLQRPAGTGTAVSTRAPVDHRVSHLERGSPR